MRQLHGTWPLVRVVVARDRLRLLAWVGGIVALVFVSAVTTRDIYPTQEALDEAAALAIDNPAALAFNGPAQALDTIGGQIAFQIGAFGLLVVGLMAVLLTGRVTRGEEESGRLELVRSMPVGPLAPFAAALVVVTGTAAVVGALVTLSLLSEDLPVAGSVVLGASYVAFGFAFVGVTAVTAQVSENPRVTNGIAGAVLGTAFALRAVGDMGEEWLSWLSPMGWAQRARPYAGERWWPLAMLLVLGVALVRVAVALSNRRDFASGLVEPRPGPPRASRWLASPIGLAVRLHRGAFLWWAVAVLALGLVYGSLAQAIDEFVSDNPALEDVLASYGEASLTDSYLATALLVIALLAAGAGLQVALRLRGEEAELRAEPMLATPVPRPRWMASHVLAALVAGGLAVVGGGLGVGVAYALVGGGARQVPRLTAASVAYVPALWLLVALAVALFGLAPRWAAGAWVALALCFAIATFGPLLDLPAWVYDLSPFQHVPAVPADALRVLPLAVLTAVAALLAVVGFRSFRARDLASS